MNYSISRKYNLKARIPDNPQYEMVELMIEGAETKEEAENELREWAESYFTGLRSDFLAKKTPEQRFDESLDQL